jgi:hypothetical protein
LQPRREAIVPDSVLLLQQTGMLCLLKVTTETYMLLRVTTGKRRQCRPTGKAEQALKRQILLSFSARIISLQANEKRETARMTEKSQKWVLGVKMTERGQKWQKMPKMGSRSEND